MDTLQIARFAQQVIEDYPKNEIQPARPLQTEEFGIPTLRFPIEILSELSSQRFWLISADDAMLFQVQSDFLACNWRRREGGRDYPRYSTLRTEVERGLKIVEELLSESGMKPTWCEVSYVNQIPPLHDDPNIRPPLHRLLRNVGDGAVASLPPVEDRQVGQRFRIEEDGKPVGRVTVVANPGYVMQPEQPIYGITLTARLLAKEPSLSGALAALDQGRELVDKAFVEMTTDEMHELWGLKTDGDAR